MFSRIQQPRLTIWLAIAGALSFWLPDLAVHVAARLDSAPARWDAAFVFLGVIFPASKPSAQSASTRGTPNCGNLTVEGNSAQPFKM